MSVVEAVQHLLGYSDVKKTLTNVGKVAIEVSRHCKPWDKAQIVVMLSRTRMACGTIIISFHGYANRMNNWLILHKVNPN